MRTILTSLLPIALAAFCFQAPKAAEAHGVAQPTGARVAYTNVAPQAAAAAEVIPVRIDVRFTADERAKIIEAVKHWNHSLNGQIRFDLQAQGYDPEAPQARIGGRTNTWIVARVVGTSASPVPGKGPQLGTLAQAQSLGDGGIVTVFAEKIGNRDLAQIMLHEFGHVLGLGHENAGRLMAPYYSASAQQCIDKGAVQAVAQLKGLPFEALNWCGDAATVAQRNAGQIASR
jgi:hypothetical protein